MIILILFIIIQNKEIFINNPAVFLVLEQIIFIKKPIQIMTTLVGKRISFEEEIPRLRV